MTTTCETVREWLQEERDGELSVLRRTPLREHLEGCAGCRAAAARQEALARMLDDDLVEVPADFRRTVMAGLPAAAWEVRRSGAWVAAAVALLAVLLAGAGLGLAAGDLPGLGALRALGDLAAESVVAGAGLAGASWQGLWLAIAELRQAQPWIPFAVGLLAALLCVLLWRLARGRRAYAPSLPGASRKPSAGGAERGPQRSTRSRSSE